MPIYFFFKICNIILWQTYWFIIFYYEDIENLDGLIPFASDGCGIAFAFDKKSEEIVSIPMDCLERNYAKIIAVNYDDFIDRICSHKLQY